MADRNDYFQNINKTFQAETLQNGAEPVAAP